MQLDCSICLETMLNQLENEKTPCGHDFHKECLSKWLKNADNCPLCRGSLSEKKIKQLEQDQINSTAVLASVVVLFSTLIVGSFCLLNGASCMEKLPEMIKFSVFTLVAVYNNVR